MGSVVSAGAMKVRLKYVVEDVDRHGKVRIYFRRKGRPKIRLPGMPHTPEFLAAYQAALEASGTAAVGRNSGGAQKAPAGSLRWLCQAYYESAEFKLLSPRTRYVRRAILDRVCEADGDKPVNIMEPRHVRMRRDAKAETPEAANAIVKALRQAFAYGVASDLVARNPTKDVPYIKTGSEGFYTWTVDDVRRFQDRHPIGTKARLALSLMLYAGLRRSDAVALGRQHARDGWFAFTVTKNRSRKPATLQIPILPELQAVINASPSGNLTFLVTQFGKPFTANGFGNWFRRRCDEAGLPHCSAHGLRKAGATLAAENGATEHQLMAIFGWASPKQAAHYTKAVRQKVLAASGMRFLVSHTGNESVQPETGDAARVSNLPSK